MKRAILIGCNYTATPSAKLYGCIDDIVNISNMLIDAYAYKPANITVLRDDSSPSIAPTRANILNTLKSAMAASASFSELWIHYSGHGTQIRDTNRDETPGDGMDEAIVPSDFMSAGYILDDELYGILNTSKCPTLVFFDSCHSGSACDLPYSINYVNGAFSKSVSSRNTNMSNPNVIMMSGCRDPQTSADAYNNYSTLAEGAFTMCLIQALRQNDHMVDIMKLYGDVCYGLVKNRFSQIPVLSSSVAAPKYSFSRAGPVSSPVLSPAPVANSRPTGIPVLFAAKTAKEILRGNMKSVIESSTKYLM